jgi:hypothetical protein
MLVSRDTASCLLAAMERDLTSCSSRRTSEANANDVTIELPRFIAAVRAVLYFDEFYAAAEAVFVKYAGSVDAAMPLQIALAELFPQVADTAAAMGAPVSLRAAVNERLDISPDGNTLVKLSALTSAVCSIQCKK